MHLSAVVRPQYGHVTVSMTAGEASQDGRNAGGSWPPPAAPDAGRTTALIMARSLLAGHPGLLRVRACAVNQ
jgi:hypothetical protein